MSLSVVGGYATARTGTSTSSFSVDLNAETGMTGVLENDLLITSWAIPNVITLTIPTTNGTWTDLDSGNITGTGSDMAWFIGARAAAASEASETWSMSSSQRPSYAFMAVRGVDLGDIYRTAISRTYTSTTGSASFVAPSLTGGLPGDLLVCIYGTDFYSTAGTYSWSVPEGMTVAAGTALGDTTQSLICYKTLPAGFTGATGTQTATATAGANRNFAASLIIRNSDSAPPPPPPSTYGFKEGMHF